MGEFQLSSKAKEDLGKIADFTIENFGIQQARVYKDELIDCFKSLSINPNIGRHYPIKNIHGLKVFPFKAHSIFYIQRENHVLIVRILGARMDFDRHL